MEKFYITITETLERTIIVEAPDAEQAIEKAEELCNAGTVELDSMDFVGREIQVGDKEDYRCAEKLQHFKTEVQNYAEKSVSETVSKT